jgi:hypothetical protein
VHLYLQFFSELTQLQPLTLHRVKELYLSQLKLPVSHKAMHSIFFKSLQSPVVNEQLSSHEYKSLSMDGFTELLYRLALHLYNKSSHKDKIKEVKGKRTDYGDLPRSVINFFNESDYNKFKEICKLTITSNAKLNTPAIVKLFKKEKVEEAK